MKKLLSSPRCYNALQNLLSGPRRRERLLRQILRVPDKGRVLDIGCGTANVLAHLSTDVEYVGFDASADYIAFARARYAKRRASFHEKRIEQADVDGLGAFDVVIATGILHHLDDEAAVRLFELASTALADDGVLMTLDPCFVERQNPIARRLVGNDRGEFVRSFERYPELARSHFGRVEAIHRSDLLRIPYDHCVMLCRA